MQTRLIPRTNEALPVVGCGTYRGFDVSERSAEYSRLSEVVDVLLGAGGSVLDSSPMYGRAEAIRAACSRPPARASAPSSPRRCEPTGAPKASGKWSGRSRCYAPITSI